MSITHALQTAAVALLEAKMPEPGIEVLSRKPGTPSSDFEAAIAEQVLGVFVMPPIPVSALQGSPHLFIDRYEVRVRIIEQPAMNALPIDAYDLIEVVANALHWQMLPCLAHPLQISPRPVEAAENEEHRLIDVIFYAAAQLNRS